MIDSHLCGKPMQPMAASESAHGGGSGASRSQRWLPILLGSLLAALPWLLAYNELPQRSPILRDAGVFLYGGERLLHGEMLYTRVWDHKPPMVFLWNAMGLALHGRMGVLLIETALFSLGVVALFLAMVRVYSVWPSFVGGLLLVFWSRSPSFYEGGNFTECYASPFIMVVLAVWLTQPRNLWLWFGAGACSALAFLTKQTSVAVPFAVFLGIAFVWLMEKRRDDAKRLRSFVLGAGLVAGAMVLLLAWMSALSAFWDASFVYSRLYVSSKQAEAGGLKVLVNTFDALFMLGPGSLIVFAGVCWALLSLPPLRNATGASTRVHVLLLVALVVEVVCETLPFRFYGHYYLHLLPLASIAFPAWCRIVGHVGRSVFAGFPKTAPRRFAAVAAGLLPLFLMPANLSVTGMRLTAQHGSILSDARWKLVGSQKALVSEVVNAAREEDLDGLCVWGGETWLNFAAGLKCPSRYCYNYPLLTPGYGETRLTEFIGELAAHPRSLLIDANPDGSNSLCIDPHGPPPGSWTNPHMKELREFVAKNYRPAKTIGNGWVMYMPLNARGAHGHVP